MSEVNTLSLTFCPNNFWTEIAIFLGIYFKKPDKDCEFADRQHNALIHEYTNISIWIFHLKQNIFNFSTAKKIYIYIYIYKTPSK